MKYLLQTACAAVLICVSSYSYAAKGINYDPAHSIDYRNAQSNNNLTNLTDSINKDLSQIKTMGFTIIKTFYAQFCTINAGCADIAQLASVKGLQVLLGVYEFEARDGCGNDCITWTNAQRDAAIHAKLIYRPTVIGIVVGNEDMFDFAGAPQPTMQDRIVKDIIYIRAHLQSDPAPVSTTITTGQRQPDWVRLNANDPYGVVSTVDAIGANIYPFWGNSPEKLKNVSVANNIPASVNELQTLTGKPVIVTEEGWPSCGSNPNTQDSNIGSKTDYFNTWKSRVDGFDSYYFATYDNYVPNPNSGLNCNAPNKNGPFYDANNYFGLCQASSVTKGSGLCNCSASCFAPGRSSVSRSRLR